MYPFQPLDDEKQEIRLILVLPVAGTTHTTRMLSDVHAPADQPLRLSLKTFSLLDLSPEYKAFLERWSATSSRAALTVKWRERYGTQKRYNWGDFMALSYVWGDPQENTVVDVDGYSVVATKTLVSFLSCVYGQSLSGDVGYVYYWADALSINQLDITEKQIQIPNMHRIYESSNATHIYLGPDEGFATSTFNFIRQAAAAWRGSLEDLQIFQALVKGSDSFGMDWEGYFRFLQNPWWSRLWILQEVALGGPGSQMQWGTAWVFWSDVCDCFSATKDILEPVFDKHLQAKQGVERNRIGPYYYRAMSFKRFRFVENVYEKLQVWETLMFVRQALCYDDRDRVYGVLALLPQNVSSRILVSYTSTVQQVYQNFARALISSTKRLDIIYWDSSKDILDPSIVSWTPNFACESQFVGSFMDPSRSASQTTEHRLEVQTHGNLLLCEGFFLDEVDGLSCGCWRVDAEAEHINIQPRNNMCRFEDGNAISEALWYTLLEKTGQITSSTIQKLQSLPLFKRKAMTHFNVVCSTDHRSFPEMILAHLDRFQICNGAFIIFGKTFADRFPIQPDKYTLPNRAELYESEFLSALKALRLSRKLFTTRSGFLGTGPKRMLPKDRVCILMGASSPVLLRAVEHEGERRYRVVGDCFIHTLMQGEAMQLLKSGENKLQKLVLI